MSGCIMKVCASSKPELEKEVRKTLKEARSMGLLGIHAGWDPKNVVKTENGYEIAIWVHNEMSSELLNSLLRK